MKRNDWSVLLISTLYKKMVEGLRYNTYYILMYSSDYVIPQVTMPFQPYFYIATSKVSVMWLLELSWQQW